MCDYLLREDPVSLSINMSKDRTLHIIHDDMWAVIAPSFPSLEQHLHYTEKRMEQTQEKGEKWPTKKIKKYRMPLFTVVPEPGVPHKVIRVHHGTLAKVLEFMAARFPHVQVVQKDRRQPFPFPRLDLMHGFRFGQKAMTVQALVQNKSGLIGAPTRYGKSTILENIIRAFPSLTTVVAIPGKDLLDQTYDRLKQTLPGREVIKLGGGSSKKYPSEDVTVCSMDSLHKCDPGRVRLLIVDEPHEAVTPSRVPEFEKFELARKYGLGATLEGRFDGRDALITALLGPVLVNKTYTEALAEGAICPVKVIFIRIKFKDFTAWTRDVAYRRLLHENAGMAEVAAFISNELIPPQWQTLMFIENEKQANLVLKHVGEEGTLCMAKKFANDKERRARFAEMQEDRIKRCVCTDIYGQGVTFSRVIAMMNLCGGGKNTGSIQKPGRLAELRPGKRCGVVFDFLFERELDEGEHPNNPNAPEIKCPPDAQWVWLVRDSKARIDLYRSKGYETFIVDGPDELRACVEREVF